MSRYMCCSNITAACMETFKITKSSHSEPLNSWITVKQAELQQSSTPYTSCRLHLNHVLNDALFKCQDLCNAPDLKPGFVGLLSADFLLLWDGSTPSLCWIHYSNDFHLYLFAYLPYKSHRAAKDDEGAWNGQLQSTYGATRGANSQQYYQPTQGRYQLQFAVQKLQQQRLQPQQFLDQSHFRHQVQRRPLDCFAVYLFIYKFTPTKNKWSIVNV